MDRTSNETNNTNAKTEVEASVSGEGNEGAEGEHPVVRGTCATWEDMDLKDNLLRGIYGHGFETPSPIQQRAIGPILNGGDVIAQAQSGTGKTGTFVTSILQTIDNDLPEVQALIVAPTRELALQIDSEMKNIGFHLNVKTVRCIGKTDPKENIREVEDGAQVAIGTPGRMIYLIEKGKIRMDNVKMLVMDEADEMLSTGFLDQVKCILSEIPHDAQVCLISATMPPEMLELSKRFMKDPQKILVKADQLTLEGIKQFYIALEKEQYKLDTLLDLYDKLTITQAIIYVNTKRKVDWLAEKLRENNFTVSYIHGAMEQRERNQVMRQFRSGESRVLIATNLLSRGIDVQQVSLVLNYDLPQANDKESYLHRIGRSGRFGRKGVSINFITPTDLPVQRDLERYYNTQIEEMPMNISDYM
jgi:superfamily II DNA/RNA helicase